MSSRYLFVNTGNRTAADFGRIRIQWRQAYCRHLIIDLPLPIICSSQHIKKCANFSILESDIIYLFCECEYYSEPLWNKLVEILTMLFIDISLDRVPRVELGQTNVIFNIPHPSLLLHVHDKASRNAILLLIQEVKRGIIFRKINLPHSAQQITDPWRLAAHLDSAICRLRSYKQYIGLVKYTKAANLLLRL